MKRQELVIDKEKEKRLRQKKALLSFGQMRKKAKNIGFMSEKEIDIEINNARKNI